MVCWDKVRLIKKLTIDHQGWLLEAAKVPSPNFNCRPEHTDVSLLVIHNISLPPNQFGGPYIRDFFANNLDVTHHPYFEEIADLNVSAHFLIDRQGVLTQFVSCDARAWHAGESCHEGVDNCNNYSIGVELEGADETPYSSRQYEMLVSLTQSLMSHYPAITKQRIVGHSAIAPDRKTDPGSAFDWRRFYTALEV